MALFRRLTCRRCTAAVLLGGEVSKGMWPSSMGGWSRKGGGRPLGAAGLERMVAVLWGRLGLVVRSSQGGVGGGSTPGHQELLGKDRERKKVGNKVHMR
jgi:hypothetical protein